MNEYDVIVAGGGMVGLATALALGRQGRRVAVVEPQPVPVIDDGRIELRVSAVSRASQALLGRLGAWGSIESAALAAYREMRVWDWQVPPDSAQVLSFDSAAIGEPELGFIVENRRIVAALARTIAALDNIELLVPARAGSVELGDDAATVVLEDGRRLRAQLLVGADGGRSQTRAMAGIETRGWSYEQRAVVTHVTTAEGHRDTAFQRFLPEGPLALLPLYDGRSSIVWSTTPERAEELLALDDAGFVSAVTDGCDRVLGEVTDCDRRAAFPLHLSHAIDYCRSRFVLVGDAAHSVHPLAGQGVNLGFADAAGLADTLDGVSPRALGDLAVLRRYERARKGDNLLMMGSLDALNRLFRSDSELVGRVRQTGLSLFNRLTPLKHAVIRRAMGG